MPKNTTPIAAIDAGSNGIRLILASVHQDQTVHIHDQRRYPVRIGKDAFDTGTLTTQTISEVTDAFVQIKRRIDRHQINPKNVKAIATSALRNTKNATELINRISLLTGIQLTIITPHLEAKLGFLAISRVHDLKNKNTLIIDMGGGSIEFTTSKNNKVQESVSLALGPVRILTQIKNNPKLNLHAILNPYLDTIKQLTQNTPPDKTLATGGNIKSTLHLSQQLLQNTSKDTFTQEHTQNLIKILTPMSIEERIGVLGLRTDRADIILIATQITLAIMQTTKSPQFKLTKAGLKEGVIYDLAQEIQ